MHLLSQQPPGMERTVSAMHATEEHVADRLRFHDPKSSDDVWDAARGPGTELAKANQ
jgi:hypothetical protein